MQQCPLVDSFLQQPHFAPNEYATVLETLLLLGVQAVQQQHPHPEVAVTLAGLKQMLAVDPRLSYAENGYIPRAKLAVQQFQEKIAALEREQATTIADRVVSQDSSDKAVAVTEAKAIATEPAPVRQRPVLQATLLKAQTNEKNKSSSGARYPDWWGHREMPTKSTAAKSSGVNVKRSTGRVSDPWKIPRRMVDECVQTSDLSVQYAWMADEKDQRLRRAARRLEPPPRGPSSMAYYNDGLDMYAELDDDDYSVPVPTVRTPNSKLHGPQPTVQSAVFSAPPPRRAKSPVLLSFSPPRRTRRTTSSSPALVKPQIRKTNVRNVENLPPATTDSPPVTRVIKHDKPVREANTQPNDGTESDFIAIAKEFVSSEFLRCLD